MFFKVTFSKIKKWEEEKNIEKLKKVFSNSQIDHEIRLGASKALGKTANSDTIKYLVNYIGNSGTITNDDSKHFCIIALEKVQNKDALMELVQCVSDPKLDKDVKLVCIETLRKIGDSTALQSLLKITKNKDTDLCKAAFRAIQYFELDKKANVQLIKRLSEKELEESIRIIIIRTLSIRTADKSEKEKIVRILSSLLVDQSKTIKLEAIQVLRELGLPSALSPLIAKLSDRDPTVRSAAARAIGNFDSSEALDALITKLSDYDPRVRSAVIGTIGSFDSSEALDALITKLSDRDPTVRSAAARAIGNFDSSEALDALIDSLSDSNLSVRQSIIQALLKFKDKKALDAIASNASDKFLRKEVALCLANVGDERAISILLQWLKDEMTTNKVRMDDSDNPYKKVVSTVNKTLSSLLNYKLSKKSLQKITNIKDIKLAVACHDSQGDNVGYTYETYSFHLIREKAQKLLDASNEV